MLVGEQFMGVVRDDVCGLEWREGCGRGLADTDMFVLWHRDGSTNARKALIKGLQQLVRQYRLPVEYSLA